jgi:hypothetical protein
MVFKVPKNAPWKVQMVVVRAIPNLVLSPNNIVLLVAINKFNPHPILVNVKEFKPYQLFAIS